MNITREEFERLLDKYADAFAAAVLAADYGAEEYRAATDKAVEAKQALMKAVFP